ncbi:MAG: 3'-5' exonuclease [Gammaproteobacteria bacterium]
MAELIPSLNSCLPRMQAGEKRFARRLATHLEDDYLCWYETGVGNRPRFTDFAILHPTRGLLLLEVKDWKLETIKSANPDSFELLVGTGLKIVQSPLKQARLCMYQLLNQLERDPQLTHQQGEYQGKLVMPYGFGVVLTNITRAQFNRANIDSVIPEHLVICKDEMVESTDIEAFQQRLWDMFNYRFREPLTQPQIDRVRWHMFPEIRMQPQPELDISGENEADVFEIPDIVKVMDLQQEKLARGLGAGHRVIHGVAGSGKTMILGYRCLHLAKLTRKPVLVLCYNVALAARLGSLIEEHGVCDRVNVYSIHRWASTMLKSYNLPSPELKDGNYDAAIELLIDSVEKGSIPRGQYGAVLIDEGHDFKHEWLRLVVDMVDPETKSLLLLYDDTQSIYRRSSGMGFSLKDVGVEARGRTTVLKVNYRNTQEILELSFNFIGDFVNPSKTGDDSLPIIEPDSAGRNGSAPAIKRFASFDDEATYIASIFKKMHVERDVPWSDMCALYCHNWMGQALSNAMAEAGIPYVWLRDSATKRKFIASGESVKLLTMHSSKGLEFPTVATCGIGSLGVDETRIEADAKLLYVAMTRATQNLLITSSKSSPFSEKLGAMIETKSAHVAAAGATL